MLSHCLNNPQYELFHGSVVPEFTCVLFPLRCVAPSQASYPYHTEQRDDRAYCNHVHYQYFPSTFVSKARLQRTAYIKVDKAPVHSRFQCRREQASAQRKKSVVSGGAKSHMHPTAVFEMAVFEKGNVPRNCSQAMQQRLREMNDCSLHLKALLYLSLAPLDFSLH